MVDRVDSRYARAGGTFRFRTTQDAKFDGGENVPKGTTGYGVVRFADAAGPRSHDGALALEPRYLVVPTRDGRSERLEVTMNPTLPAMWTPREPLLQQAASKVPLPLPGIAITAMNAMKWGRNITLGPGFTFSILPITNLARGPIC